MRVDDLVSPGSGPLGYLGVGPSFPAVGSQRWIPENLDDGGSPHQFDEMDDFDSVSDSEKALGVARSGLSISIDDIKVCQQKRI